MLRRNLELDALPVPSLDTDSSGGSDKGLDVLVNGLAGGLLSSVDVTALLKCEGF